MQAVKRLDGSTDYHILDYKLSATVVEGQPVIASTTGADGGEVTDATTTSLLDMLGIVLGASGLASPRSVGLAGSLTYSATQGDTEGMVRVIVNPDAIIRALMSGGAAAGTALVLLSNTAASAGGTLITDADVGTASMDDGIVWCISGANVGQSRKITTFTSATSITVTVPFRRAIAVSDEFLQVPYLPLTTRAIQITTNLLEANAVIAVGTGGNATVVEVILNGRSDSYVHFIARDHIFNELS